MTAQATAAKPSSGLAKQVMPASTPTATMLQMSHRHHATTLTFFFLDERQLGREYDDQQRTEQHGKEVNTEEGESAAELRHPGVATV